MTSIHEKLYGVEQASPEEVAAVNQQVNATAEALSVGLEQLSPVSFDLFSEAMKALMAAGFSNFREMDENAFNVWHETLKGLGESLFSFTIQKLIATGNQRFKTGRLLLGDVVQVAEEAYQEILDQIEENVAAVDSDIPAKMRFFQMTKKMGLPSRSPVDHVQKMFLIKSIPAMTNQDLRSLPVAADADLEISDFRPDLHGVQEVF